MRASDLLQAAYVMGMSNGAVIHQKWVQVSHNLAGMGGVTHLGSLQQNNRLDLLLRQLEGERLESMQRGSSNEVDLTLDLQFSLSECWVLRAYEAVRAANQQLESDGKADPKLTVLAHRLAVVRMPIAKGEIEGMHKRENRKNPPLLVIAGETTPFPYAPDGTYVMPRGLCSETGAALWYPVDMTTRDTVAICRRDLSDELLTLFD